MEATRIKLCQNKKHLNNLLIFVILLSAVVMTVLSTGSSSRSGNDYDFSADAQLINQQQEKQLPSSLTLSPTVGPTPSIKITSHNSGQQVKVGPLTITGTSSDTSSSNCQVYADWNDNMPFGKAIAAGPGGPNDYSKWTFTYDSGYHLIQNGTNNLTSKISCVEGPAASTKWYSIDLIGVNDAGPTINQAITTDPPSAPPSPSLGLTEFPSPFSTPTQADLTPTSLDPVVGEEDEEDEEDDEEDDDSDSDDSNVDEEEDNTEGDEDSDESGDGDSEDNQDEEGGDGDDGDDGDDGGAGDE
jgi:hypothetical protein